MRGKPYSKYMRRGFYPDTEHIRAHALELAEKLQATYGWSVEVEVDKVRKIKDSKEGRGYSPPGLKYEVKTYGGDLMLEEVSEFRLADFDRLEEVWEAEAKINDLPADFKFYVRYYDFPNMEPAYYHLQEVIAIQGDEPLDDWEVLRYPWRYPILNGEEAPSVRICHEADRYFVRFHRHEWERGGAKTNGQAEAFIITGPNGEKLPPFLIKEGGALANAGHALFRVEPGYHIIRVHGADYSNPHYHDMETDEWEFGISIDRIMSEDWRQDKMVFYCGWSPSRGFYVSHWGGDETNPSGTPPEKFRPAVEAGIKKAMHLHCREPYYYEAQVSAR